MVRRPEEYWWSSHREYIGLNKDGLVDKGLVMGMFSKDLKRGRRLYLEYMREDEKALKEDFYRTVDQRVLGDEGFIEWVKERVRSGTLEGKRRHAVSLREIARGIGEVFGIPLGELREKGKNSGVMEGRRLFSLGAREIADFFGEEPGCDYGIF